MLHLPHHVTGSDTLQRTAAADRLAIQPGCVQLPFLSKAAATPQVSPCQSQKHLKPALDRSWRLVMLFADLIMMVSKAQLHFAANNMQ